ncbi:MAG: hypothetical protein ACREL9_09235 [Gemmatimonadales bacterium]
MRGGRTRIAIRENLAPSVGAIWGGIGGGMGPIMGILVGALHFPPIALGVIIPMWLATTYVTARTVYGRTVNRERRELEGLADRLAALACELAPERPVLRRP